MKTSPTNAKTPKRRGRPPKPISERAVSRISPYRSNKPRHSIKKKKEVVIWLAYTQIPLKQSIARQGFALPTRQISGDGLEPLEPGFRRPTFLEAASFFKICQSTICGWWQLRKDLLKGFKFENTVTTTTDQK
ncbi:uncharacterized protein GGS22DRAFT_170276 [Annulohypoxylon maeteangense]|uniref:uncharacterized protein n=1 Tax=Annulohypoxylon maeteangense TaxID=1927788 RepID=UPI002008395A|nr:uncharacterized protein GGS22DRAFT_170276 [Annulohypoxylon maeteangense]KAI0882128.1 hypothetical protein GGS22DRAFT_170276 [Annulohypoxylon maeteangense]